ncbi:MAG: hypothetical protein MJZ38_07130, partial [archaeon]|nr:hypothetical protein [archaeon]
MSKKRSFRYICPCCYGSIDMNQVHYACRNPSCAGTFLSSCSDAEARRYGSAYVSAEEIDVERSEFLGLDPRGPNAVTTKYHVIRGSVNGTCEQCNSRNTTKLCPRCHTIISKGAEKYGTAIYVVTGSENAGKSHYLASAINVLKDEYAREFEVDVRASSEKTTVKFHREYHSTVF